MIFDPDPQVGQQATYGGKTWVWEGQAWLVAPKPTGASLATSPVEVRHRAYPSIIPVEHITTTMVQV